MPYRSSQLCPMLIPADRVPASGIDIHSAQVNILASVLLLGAALLRFYDLLLNEYREQTGTLSQPQFDEIDDLPPV